MKSPIQLLREFEKRVVKRALPFPQEELASDSMDVVAFKLLGQRLMIEMSSVSEVLPLPPITRLPRVRPWVRGVANIHGQILPIVDLSSYLSNASQRLQSSQRIIAITHEHYRLGFMVEQVMGLRHIRRDKIQATLPATLPDYLHPYVQGCVEYEEETWAIFSADQLNDSRLFKEMEAV